MTAALRAWRPEKAVEIVAGTPPGGGLDRTARALVSAIEAARLVDVPIAVRNVPGDGSRKAWTYMDLHRGDPHVISVSHPNLTTDRLVGLANFDLRAYTPIAILYTEYIAFVARADSTVRTAADLLRRAKDDASALSVALSTSLGNSNHIALAHVVQHAGANPKAPLVRVFDSALDAVADVVAGKSEIGAVTAASVLPALATGALRVLAISAPERLGGAFAGVPVWRELGVDSAVGAWRGIAGASGIGESHIAYWRDTLSAATATEAWQSELERNNWAASYLDGTLLHEYLERERSVMTATLGELDMLRP